LIASKRLVRRDLRFRFRFRFKSRFRFAFIFSRRKGKEAGRQAVNPSREQEQERVSKPSLAPLF
jgi:hypothetical protein